MPINTFDEPGERPSSVDDMASQREAQFTAMSLAACRRAGVPSTPGVCLNCQAQLANLAVYCDGDCRADHEQRLARQRRAGAAG